jgi:predicted nucleic acid-binding protein
VKLVLDANILIRGVLGTRVPALIGKYSRRVELFAPDTAFREAAEELPLILRKRKMPEDAGLDALQKLFVLVRAVDPEVYSDLEAISRRLIARRDEDDWPILAVALTLDCPIWTEDADFFGCGVATWTTDRVEFYLQKAPYNL